MRIIGDIIAGSLLAGGLRLVVVKAFLEPAAMFVGRYAYRRVDDAMGDRLQDVFRDDATKPPPPAA